MNVESIDLGSQRLSVSSELGNDFALVLEGKAGVSEGHEELIRDVRKQISENPRTQIIGTKLTEESALSDVVASLSRQMGLPPGSQLRDIRNRLVGRENDFLMLVLDADRLPEKRKRGLEKRLKSLKVKTIFG